MKKKIKDLTKNEINKICENYYCKECPLFTYKDWCRCKDDLLGLYGEEEIEVEDYE